MNNKIPHVAMEYVAIGDDDDVDDERRLTLQNLVE